MHAEHLRRGPRTCVTERPSSLPPGFLRELDGLEEAYLRRSDPMEQSGFHGGAARWRAEREPILDAIPADGDLLDIGCANGYLLECLVGWARERGVMLTPYGLDRGPRLIELARRRFPDRPDHFFVGNAWSWKSTRPFRYVYMLLDVVPSDYLSWHLPRIVEQLVAPGGRLIIGDYGSRSRGIPARDVAAVLRASGLTVSGKTQAGSIHQTRFAWSERLPNPGQRLEERRDVSLHRGDDVVE